MDGLIQLFHTETDVFSKKTQILFINLIPQHSCVKINSKDRKIFTFLLFISNQIQPKKQNGKWHHCLEITIWYLWWWFHYLFIFRKCLKKWLNNIDWIRHQKDFWLSLHLQFPLFYAPCGINKEPNDISMD